MEAPFSLSISSLLPFGRPVRWVLSEYSGLVLLYGGQTNKTAGFDRLGPSWVGVPDDEGADMMMVPLL